MRNRYKLKTRFGPPERFKPEVRKGVLPIQEVTAAFDRQKEKLTDELVCETTAPAVAQRIVDAIRSAEAAAWGTPYPTLFMNELAHEKVGEARKQAQTQERIRLQTEEIVAIVA